MFMETKLKLPNKNANLWLEKCPDDSWKLKSDKDYIIKYMRILFGDNNHQEIKAIDPSGGPFITVGYKIGKYKVMEIKRNYNLILE